MLGDAILTDRMQQLLDPALGDVRIAAKVQERRTLCDGIVLPLGHGTGGLKPA
jgi:hypothetical protein